MPHNYNLLMLLSSLLNDTAGKLCDNLDDGKREQVKESDKIRKKFVIPLMMLKEKRLDAMTKTEERTSMWKLKMKEDRFLIMSMDVVWLIHLLLQHQHSK